MDTAFAEDRAGAFRRKVSLIGVAVGHGAEDRRTAHAPNAIASVGVEDRLRGLGVETDWRMIAPRIADAERAPEIDVVADVCEQLARAAEEALVDGALPAVLGGDHSCAMGTWSGVYNATRDAGGAGLVWIDAHMDSHVPETSPSGNLHGMPVAHLLGHGFPRLTGLARPGPALRPDSVCLVGVRSYESAEPALLERLGVRVFPMAEVERRGLQPVMEEAIAHARAQTGAFGVSLDLDAIDPKDAPGVGSPEEGGIRAAELVDSLGALAGRTDLIGVEITEYNPALDVGEATLQIVRDLLAALVGEKAPVR